ncbi:MAG: PilW family protein [Alcanivorax sp.]|nr:PilW family protein [Alcanivorax sp.]
MRKMQQGYSIVELMIAMLLGALVVAAATQLFSANQQLFTTQQAVSRIMDDGQLVMRFLGADIRKAGYSGGAVSNLDGVAFGGGGSTESAPNDRLRVRYLGTRDCQGSESPGGPVEITNTYSVNGNRELVCNGSLSSAPVALVSGVEAFRVHYVLDTARDGLQGPFSFVGANAAELSGDPILGVRIGLLMAVPGEGLGLNEPRTWRVLDRNVETGADRVVRRFFSTTIMFRNMNWEAL